MKGAQTCQAWETVPGPLQALNKCQLLVLSPCVPVFSLHGELREMRGGVSRYHHVPGTVLSACTSFNNPHRRAKCQSFLPAPAYPPFPASFPPPFLPCIHILVPCMCSLSWCADEDSEVQKGQGASPQAPEPLARSPRAGLNCLTQRLVCAPLDQMFFAPTAHSMLTVHHCSLNVCEMNEQMVSKLSYDKGKRNMGNSGLRVGTTGSEHAGEKPAQEILGKSRLNGKPRRRGGSRGDQWGHARPCPSKVSPAFYWEFTLNWKIWTNLHWGEHSLVVIVELSAFWGGSPLILHNSSKITPRWCQKIIPWRLCQDDVYKFPHDFSSSEQGFKVVATSSLITSIVERLLYYLLRDFSVWNSFSLMVLLEGKASLHWVGAEGQGHIIRKPSWVPALESGPQPPLPSC